MYWPDLKYVARMSLTLFPQWRFALSHLHISFTRPPLVPNLWCSFSATRSSSDATCVRCWVNVQALGGGAFRCGVCMLRSEFVGLKCVGADSMSESRGTGLFRCFLFFSSGVVRIASLYLSRTTERTSFVKSPHRGFPSFLTLHPSGTKRLSGANSFLQKSCVRLAAFISWSDAIAHQYYWCVRR